MVHVLVTAHIGYIVAENQEEKKEEERVRNDEFDYTAMYIVDV